MAARRARRNVVDESESESESEAEVTPGVEPTSDSDSESDGNPYVDMEAGEASDSDDSSVEVLHVDPFPFTMLPPELRLRVWEHVCPDLRGTGRVLDFAAWHTESEGYVVAEGRCLADQTLDLRVVLSTYGESRRVALSKFPDTVPMYTDEGSVPIHINKESDVIMVSTQFDVSHDFEMPVGWEAVTNLAVPLESFILPHHVESMLTGLPHLEHVFCVFEDESPVGIRLQKKEMRWCASTLSQQYNLVTTEKAPGYGEDMTVVVCWPNVRQHWNWAKTNIPPVYPYYDTMQRKEIEQKLSEQGIDTWPMIQFSSKWGQRKLQHFKDTRDVPVLEDGSDDSDDDVDGSGDEDDDDLDDSDIAEDEYESEGIDDAEDPEVYDEDDGLPSEEDDAEVTARFSSPEASDSGARDRRRKRRVVDSEDEEDEDEAGPVAKRQRTIVVDSDDDTPAKKGRAIVIDDSESAEDESAEDESISKKKGKQAVVVDSDSDDEPVARKMTLAQRLRGNQPKADSEEEEEEEDEDELDSEDYEDDEDEEDEGEDERGGFFDTMAEEDESE